MIVRWAGFAAPFRWLVSAVDVGRHQPGVVIAAALVLAALQMAPGLLTQLFAGLGLPTGIVFGVSHALSLVLTLLVFPVTVGGFYRILDGADRGSPVRVGLLSAGFRDGSMQRLVLTQILVLLAFLLVLLAVGAVLLGTVGAEAMREAGAWFQQMSEIQAQQAAGATPTAMPTPPAALLGMGGVFLAFAPLFWLLSVGASLALAEAALRGSGARAAFVTGLRAAFINAAPLLLFALAVALPFALLTALVGMVLGAIVGVASLLGPAFGGMVAMLLFLPLTALLLAWFYAFALQGWRATCGDDAPTAATEPSTGFEA